MKNYLFFIALFLLVGTSCQKVETADPVTPETRSNYDYRIYGPRTVEVGSTHTYSIHDQAVDETNANVICEWRINGSAEILGTANRTASQATVRFNVPGNFWLLVDLYTRDSHTLLGSASLYIGNPIGSGSGGGGDTPTFPGTND